MTLITDRLKQVFDQALSLEPGEFITLSCSSPQQADSYRTMLHRERSRFREVTGTDDNITVSKIRGTNDLKLEKAPEMPPITITRKNGSVEEFIPETSKNDILSGMLESTNGEEEEPCPICGGPDTDFMCIKCRLIADRRKQNDNVNSESGEDQ